MPYHPETAAFLAELYRNLRGHFGYAHPWWPGTPFQISITAVLVQQCDWTVAWDAVLQLQAEGYLGLSDLAEAAPEQIQKSIRRVTFAPTKSSRLVNIAGSIRQAGFETFTEFLSTGHDTRRLRNEVLRLPGIGPETADCWLGFASEHPVFVVDAYTRRIFERLGAVPHVPRDVWRKGRYEQIRQFFETHLLSDLGLYEEFSFPACLPREVALLRDYHALLVELAKHHCVKTRPHCHLPGKPGWQNYDSCLTHCQSETCTACPLSELCQSTADF